MAVHTHTKNQQHSWKIFALTSHLKQVVQFFGLDHRIKPHSPRIGAATNAAIQGIAESKIKRFGRWASSSYLGYISVPVVSLLGISN